MEQFGVLGILEVAGVVAGQPNLMKRFVQTGSSDGTSILSKNLRKLPLGAFKKAQWAPTLRNLLATTTGRGAFIARWIPWIGSGMLMYDAGMSLYNTQLIFNKITANGR